MQTSQEVIEKLQKLLRLAGSANQHEAELAMQRAQELAVKYKVELASVDPSERPKEEYERDTLNRHRTFQQKYIDWILGRHFNVKPIYAGGTGGATIYLVGKRTDIEFGRWVHEFLQNEFPRLWEKYHVETRCRQGERVNYFYGLYLGLDAKLTEARERAERESFEQARFDRGEAAGAQLASNYQLAVVNDKTALAAAIGKFFPRLSSARGGGINLRHAGAVEAGREAGRTININRPLGGRSSATHRLQ